MNILKKILSFLVLNILILSSAGQSVVNAGEIQGETATLAKEVIVAKYSLEKSRVGKKYIKQIDSLIHKLESDKNIKSLEKINSKIDTLITSIENKSDSKSRFLNSLLKYLKAKINLANYTIKNSEPKLSLDEIFASDLSDSEKQKVEDEVVSLQLNLFEKTTNLLEKLTNNFEKLSNYEDKGDFKASLKVDHEEIGKMDYDFSFSDYSLKSSNFDSQLKGKVEAIINASSHGKDINLELSSLIDFISKDGNIYLLLDKLSIIGEESADDFKDFLDKLKRLAVDNKYIKYGDQESRSTLKILNNLTPTKIIADGRNILSKPMFEAYKKEDDRYLLKPTKYACDKLKELSGRFDPFHSNYRCSDGQYEDILRNLNESGELYIILGTENQIGFNGKDSNTDFMGFIMYDDNSINQIKVNIVPNQIKFPDEGFELNYIKNQSLYLKLIAEKGDVDYNLTSTLDSNNRFKTLKYSGKTINNYYEYNTNLKLENKKITGDYEFNSIRHNWDTGEDTKYFTISGDISGTTLSNNKLSALNMDIKGVNLKDNKEFLNISLNYKSGKLEFSLLSTSNYMIGKLDFSCNWDSINKVITAGKLDIDVKTKDYNSDDNNYTQVWNTNLELNNKNISGLTVISNNKEKLVTITHSGKYEKEFLEFNNFIELKKNPFTELSGYSQDAKNAKVTSDLRTLEIAIKTGITKGDFELKDIVTSDNKINFETLGKIEGSYINKEDFIQPDGFEYQVFVDGNMYQLFGYKINTAGDKIAVIRGNYIQSGPTDNVSLVMYNGYYIKNEDLIEEGNIVVPEEEKVSANLNFATDLRNNKRNLDFYVNTLIGEKKIIELNIENKSTRAYKDLKIKTPTNTIDYGELFPEEENRY